MQFTSTTKQFDKPTHSAQHSTAQQQQRPNSAQYSLAVTHPTLAPASRSSEPTPTHTYYHYYYYYYYYYYYHCYHYYHYYSVPLLPP